MASTATVSCSVWRVCFVVDVSPLILRGFLLRLRFLAGFGHLQQRALLVAGREAPWRVGWGRLGMAGDGWGWLGMAGDGWGRLGTWGMAP